MHNEVTSQIASAAVVIYGLQVLKSVPIVARTIAWLPLKDAHVHRLLAAAGALLTGAGMHAAFEGNADVGWQLGLSIPPLTVLGEHAWDFATAYSMQQLGYDAVIKKG